MPKGYLEHANINVSDPDRHAQFLHDLAGWKIRWRGPAMGGGETIHVGNDSSYVALYTRPDIRGGYVKGQPLNHLALVVDDLDAAEAVVIEAGLKPWGHDDYDPGRRFYIFDWDGIEWELVSYE